MIDLQALRNEAENIKLCWQRVHLGQLIITLRIRLCKIEKCQGVHDINNYVENEMNI